MNIALDSTAAQTAAQLRGLGNRVQSGIEAGVAAVAGHNERIAARQIGRIAQRPIPTRAQVNAYRRQKRAGTLKKTRGTVGGAGAKAWERTGALARGLSTQQSRGTATIQIRGLSPDRVRGRHDLGVTRQPRNPALGIVRKNPFFDETEAITAPQNQEVFEQSFRNKLDIPG